MLATCGDPPLLVVTQAGPISLPANPTPAPTVSDSYASCDEAMSRLESGACGGVRGRGEAFRKQRYRAPVMVMATVWYARSRGLRYAAFLQATGATTIRPGCRAYLPMPVGLR